MDSVSERQVTPNIRSLTDAALDTLGCIMHTYGTESFALDTDVEPEEFPSICADIVRHIENGSAVPRLAVGQSEDGSRQLGPVRRFFVERRQMEKTFVTHRMKDYQGVVEDLIVGLRQVCQQGDNTAQTVKLNLQSVEEVVEGGKLPEIKRALADAINNVGEVFLRQRLEYEKQIHGLQERMSGLQQDLVAAHEELKLDPLTNIFNRRAFDTSIARFMKIHFMLKQQISLVMIDVDNFKSINDVCGHATGDAVLKAVAGVLSRAFVRKNDLITRFGGDEFAVILPDTSIEQSKVSIERFLSGARTVQIAELPESISISCSAGCTEIADGDTVESLIARADEALYAAKKAGRNCLKIR